MTRQQPLRRMRAVRIALAATLSVAAAALLPSEARAHQAGLTKGEAVLGADGRFHVELQADLDSLLAGVPPGMLDEGLYRELLALPSRDLAARVEKLRTTVGSSMVVLFDGEGVEAAVQFPEMEKAPTPGHTVRLTGLIPSGARTFAFAAARLYGPVILNVREEASGQTGQLVILPGAVSESFALTASASYRRTPAFLRYVYLGYEHILPRGVDHILFVLGLYLLSTRLRPLLLQVTAFTVAHSTTLALSLYGIFSLPPRVVEPLIALSIAWVAVENILTTELKPWRPAVVFLFGLMHGLGFAGVLRDIGLPRREFLSALVGFNVGVELGQVSVICLALAVAGWFRGRVWYRPRMAIPASAAIAAVGLFWAIQRAFLL